MNTRRLLHLLSVTVIIAACGRSDKGSDTASVRPDTGMPGMAMGDTSMLSQMQAHLRMTEGVSADSMMKVLSMHRMMVANMISQFNNDMRTMNMQADARWQATVDSLRSDLTRMPEMSANEINQMMPDHRGRVTRLIDMHRAMMKH